VREGISTVEWRGSVRGREVVGSNQRASTQWELEAQEFGSLLAAGFLEFFPKSRYSSCKFLVKIWIFNVFSTIYLQDNGDKCKVMLCCKMRFNPLVTGEGVGVLFCRIFYI
jgi:hypothetical protein